MFLDAVIRAGFAITGTWPMRTEMSGRMGDFGSNAVEQISDIWTRFVADAR